MIAKVEKDDAGRICKITIEEINALSSAEVVIDGKHHPAVAQMEMTGFDMVVSGLSITIPKPE